MGQPSKPESLPLISLLQQQFMPTNKKDCPTQHAFELSCKPKHCHDDQFVC